MSQPMLHFLGGVIAVLSVALASYQTWLWLHYRRQIRRIAHGALAVASAARYDFDAAEQHGRKAGAR